MLGAKLRKSREEGIPILMPSGETFKVRPVSPETFLDFEGEVLDMLTPLVGATMMGDVRGQEEFQNKFKTDGMTNEQQIELLKQYRKLFDTFAATCLISPHVVPNGEPCVGEDDCWIADIDLSDRVYLFNFLGANAKALEAFRKEQTLYMEALDREQGNESPTVEGDEFTILDAEKVGDGRLVDLPSV